MTPMHHVNSADGTPIAVHTTGTGPAVVVVNGALSTAADAAPLATALASVGLTAVTYDRRARGDSGHTPPAEPDREVEDLAAVIAATPDGASVLGHSSGAVLALYAAGGGVAAGHLFLSEPPFRFGGPTHAPDLAERLQEMVDADRPADAVLAFQREAVGLPDEFIEQFRATPAFDQVVGLAQSTVYDTLLTQRTSTPSAAMLGVGGPVTILCGVETMPLLTTAAHRLSDAMPQAELLEVPEMVGHTVHPEATARIVADRVIG